MNYESRSINLFLKITLVSFAVLILNSLFLIPSIFAATMSSSNFQVQGGEFMGGGTINSASTNFSLNASFGQVIVGNSTGANFQIGVGFQEIISSIITTPTSASTLTPSTPASSVGGGGIVGSAGGGIPAHVNAFNVPLEILPIQSGTLTRNVSAGVVILDVPINNISGKTIFIITEEPLSADNSGLIPIIDIDVNLINSTFYNVTAEDENGNPVTSFPSPITITLPIPEDLLDATDLGVYFFDEIASQWVLIPDAIFNLETRIVTFQIDHLTKFAIFEVAETPDTLPTFIIGTSLGKEEVQVGQADINIDGVVDVFDFNLLMVHWGREPSGSLSASVGEALLARRSDINNDGTIDIFDFNVLLVQWTL